MLVFVYQRLSFLRSRNSESLSDRYQMFFQIFLPNCLVEDSEPNPSILGIYISQEKDKVKL